MYAYVLVCSVYYFQINAAYPSIMKASSREELYLKIFNKHIRYFLVYYLIKNGEDVIIKKYISADVEIDKTKIFDVYYDIYQNFYDTWKKDIIQDKEYIDIKICELMNDLINNPIPEYRFNITKVCN